jgi:ADP-heptose:LPS heptosyltransferase
MMPFQVIHHLEASRYVVIHPGARSATRRWPPEWFALVGDVLAARGLQVVLTGTEEEVGLAQSVQSQMKYPAVNLAGQTSLGGLGALLSGARLLVCNDTGVSHVASAVGLPSVILFTASDPDRWAPLDHNLHRVVAWASAASPELVLEEANKLLSDGYQHEPTCLFDSSSLEQHVL